MRITDRERFPTTGLPRGAASDSDSDAATASLPVAIARVERPLPRPRPWPRPWLQRCTASLRMRVRVHELERRVGPRARELQGAAGNMLLLRIVGIEIVWLLLDQSQELRRRLRRRRRRRPSMSSTWLRMLQVRR